jgi:crotonobetainyl-CoA:carnitine CoA-transferase CaiB-like acyl-CoA transferase
MMSSVGKVTDAGAPQVGPAYADTTTGYAICSGVLAALFHRERTGEGQKVETSLLINALTTHMSAFHSVPVADQIQRDSFLQMLSESRDTGIPYLDVLRKRDELLKTAAQGNVYYRVFETADGAIAIGALSASLREKVRTTVGFEHNRDEDGYDPQNQAQLAIDASVIAHVEGIFAGHNTDEWERILTAGGVPCAPVKFVQELLEDEQVISNNYVIELEHELAGPIKMQAPPWKMSKTPPAPRGASPTLGRHTDELLAEVGYSESQIADLRQNGAIL